MLLESKGTIYEEYEKLAAGVFKAKPELVLYGFSFDARRIFPVLISLGFSIKAIVDKKKEYNGQNYQGIPIIPIEKLKDKNSVLIVCTRLALVSMLKYLKQQGFKNVLPYFFYLFDTEVPLTPETVYDIQAWYFTQFYVNSHGKNMLWSIDIPVTMRCNLKCRDCSNLMQYFKEPQHTNFEQIKNAVKKLFDAIDFCFDIRILGGEPFVNPELYKYIELFTQYAEKYKYIVVITNGTILPNAATLRVLKKENVIVSISNYNNPKQKIGQIKELFDREGVLYQISAIQYWQKCADLKKYNRTTIENMLILKNCCVHRTPAIVDGKFFRCPLAGNIYNLSAVPGSVHEYIDLLDPAITMMDTAGRIQELMGKETLKICDYCGGRSHIENVIPPAIQINKPLSYTVYS
jgi:organic radical activating enzyme